MGRITAIRYLQELVNIGILSKRKVGRESFYVNNELLKLLYESVNS